MKYCGKERGSITLFLALILSLLLSLVCTSIESVCMASARTQILNSMDIGLYSVFGQYDRKLLEEYDLFALDGSMGGGQLNLAKICDNLESYMKPVLKQNSQKLELHQSGLTGYRLLTDECGEVFYQQIVQYMQETLGSKGVQLLLNKMSDRERKTEEADLKAKQAETGGSIDRYDSEMNQASQKSRQAAQEAENRQQQEGQISTQPAPTQPQADNPISIIKRIMKMGILELVLPPGREISTRTVSKDTMVSGRQLQQGMEMPDGVTADSSYTSGVLFQQYLMNHLGNYTDPSKESLAYQMEYIFGGRDNDIDNLKSVASKLLFISVLDVRELFAGGKIPLVKTSADWQISLSNLSSLMEGLDSMRKNNEHGLSYEDYLQVLILPVSKEKKVMRAMDMIEDAIRKKGRANFYMDSCVVALEAFAEVKANRKKEFQVIRQYCYE